MNEQENTGLHATPGDIAALAERLREHAAIHSEMHSLHPDVEQAKWAGDLRAAAMLLEQSLQENGQNESHKTT